MSNGITALSYAVRMEVLGRYLGQLALMLALLTLVPLAVAVAVGVPAFAWRSVLIVVVLLAAALLARRREEPRQVLHHEALGVVSLAFLITPLLMAYPLTATGLAFEDALFEAVSAVTTTGLSTAGSIESRSPILAFTRAWMQWYGGLGIAALSVALLMGHHAAARRLMEPTDTENIATTARAHARRVLLVYLALTVAGTVLLWGWLGDGFVALAHVLSTVSTGGFSTFDDSLAAMPRSAVGVLTLLSALSAVPLVLYFAALRGKPWQLLGDPEVRALAVALLLAGAVLAVSLHRFSGLDWAAAAGHGAMLGVSAQTTTGFTTLSPQGLDPVSKLWLILVMTVGGCTGSTAGGVKLLRVLVVLRLLQHFVRRASMPRHALVRPRLGGRPLEPLDVERVLLVVASFLAVMAVSWLVFLGYGYPPLDALFEVTSALGTVGLSTGIARPELEAPLKYLLCADMLLGRLEILALMVLAYPSTWIGRRL